MAAKRSVSSSHASYSLRKRAICWIVGHSFEWYYDPWYKKDWCLCERCKSAWPTDPSDVGLKAYFAKRAPKYREQIENRPNRQGPEKAGPW